MFDRLRQLEANTTPGPWRLSHVPTSNLISAGEAWGDGKRLISHPPRTPDAEFIVAARNLWGPLVAVAEAAEAFRRGRRMSPADYAKRLDAALGALERAVKEQP